MSRHGSSPQGHPTRGTTNTNRLRRVDRWIAHQPTLRHTTNPLVVDLGFGASVVTTLELYSRLTAARPDVHVRGLEIDPQRVTRAREQLAAVRAGTTPFDANSRVDVARGGFETPTPGDARPAIIRAMNVLRQYDETDVPAAWEQMTARLQPGGIIVDGTCDEIGRIASWIAVDAHSTPRSLSISLRLRNDIRPSVAAERLPKALIHRNVPGERIHDFLRALDNEWERASALAPFGAKQRWRATIAALSDWPVLDRDRWRFGEVTVAWDAVAPRTSRNR